MADPSLTREIVITSPLVKEHYDKAAASVLACADGHAHNFNPLAFTLLSEAMVLLLRRICTPLLEQPELLLLMATTHRSMIAELLEKEIDRLIANVPNEPRKTPDE